MNVQIMNTPRMRTIDAAAAYLKERDPDTAFTKTALRQLVITGALPSVKVGVNAAKYLVDLNTLERYLTGETFTDPPEQKHTGVIRMIQT